MNKIEPEVDVADHSMDGRLVYVLFLNPVVKERYGRTERGSYVLLKTVTLEYDANFEVHGFKDIPDKVLKAASLMLFADPSSVKGVLRFRHCKTGRTIRRLSWWYRDSKRVGG